MLSVKDYTERDANMQKGKFITLSGMDGTGKTTITKMLIEKDKNGVYVQDPPQLFRQLLLTEKYDFDHYTEMLLFCAARSRIYHNEILPAIIAGKNVYCDRWFSDTFIYQGLVGGNPISLIKQIYENMIYDNIVPDISFFLIAKPETSLKRSLNRLDDEKSNETKFENKGLEFHGKIYYGILKYLDECFNEHEHLIDTEHLSIYNCYDIIKEKIK